MEWEKNATACVETKGYFNRTLKLIASVAHYTDITNYKTALLLVNTQVVRCLTKCRNWYAQQRYIIPNDWLQVQDLSMPSWQLTVEKLAIVRVHLNRFGEIFAGAPFLPVVPSLLRSLSIISGLAHIIPSILKIKPLFGVAGIGSVISLTSEFLFALVNSAFGSHLRPRVSFVVDSMEVDPSHSPRFCIVVGSLEPGNYTTMLASPG